MKIETGGKTFEALKWHAQISDSLGSVQACFASGSFKILGLLMRGLLTFNVYVGTTYLGSATTLAKAKTIANNHARAALAFGPRPIKVKP